MPAGRVELPIAKGQELTDFRHLKIGRKHAGAARDCVDAGQERRTESRTMIEKIKISLTSETNERQKAAKKFKHKNTVAEKKLRSNFKTIYLDL